MKSVRRRLAELEEQVARGQGRIDIRTNAISLCLQQLEERIRKDQRIGRSFWKVLGLVEVKEVGGEIKLSTVPGSPVDELLKKTNSDDLKQVVPVKQKKKGGKK